MAGCIQNVANYTDAVRAVLGEVGSPLDWRMALWCNYPVLWHEPEQLEDRVRKDTKKLKAEIGLHIYPGRIWYVGLPKFKVIRRGVPHLSCEIDLYYVACHPNWCDNESLCWYGKLLPKADTFEVPLALLPGLVDTFKRGELEPENARVVERGQGYSIYDYHGKEWKIPDAFLGFSWALWEKGKSFDGLLDPLTCRLLEKFTRELPAAEVKELPSADEYENIVSCLKEQMGYSKAKSEEAAKYVVEKFPDADLELKIREALNYLSG